MTKYEFINGLKAALENDLSSNLVQEHVNYYNDYINSEIRNGRSESEVIAELGDPWALAKNNVYFETHIYPNGCHGLGLAEDRNYISCWSKNAVIFLKNLGF